MKTEHSNDVATITNQHVGNSTFRRYWHLLRVGNPHYRTNFYRYRIFNSCFGYLRFK